MATSESERSVPVPPRNTQAQPKDHGTIAENQKNHEPQLPENIAINPTERHFKKKVNNMMADDGNSSMDESVMFFSAVGGSSRGRVKGFGCLLDDKVQKEKTRNRLNHAPYTALGLINAGEETDLSRAELQALLAESNHHQAEERIMRKIFIMMGSHMPTEEGPGSSSLPSHEGASHIQPGALQGMPCLTPPNQGGPFTALLNQARNDEHATDGAGMEQWFGHESSFNVNRPY